MQCIICEKPSQAKNFANALGGYHGNFNHQEYVIVNSVGHIFQFLDPSLQVDPSLTDKYKSWNLENIPWDYKELAFKKGIAKDKKDVYTKIKDNASVADDIIIATDNDPTGEGTNLAVEIILAMKLKGKHYYRCFYTDESIKEIQKGMCNLVDLGSDPTQDPDYKKSLFRSKWDFLSMQWTRVFSKVNGQGTLLRQGRLKSYMVWAVGEQIRKNQEYKKVPFYDNRFKDENGIIYTSKDEPQYSCKEDVPNIYHASEVVLDSTERKTTPPPALYDLNLLSATLASKGYSAKQVLDTYQAMYEDRNSKGEPIVSYPRTEDKTITPEQFSELLHNAVRIAEVVGVNPSLLTHTSPRTTHVKEAGSHGANRPGGNIPNSLAELEKKYGECGVEIYTFLARNALAMLCEDYEYDHESGHVKDYPKFKGSSNIPAKLGYRAIFTDESDQEDAVHLGKHAEPFVAESFPPKPKWPTAKWLAEELKKHNVGTGATRTSIYADIVADGKGQLMSDSKGKITLTPAGEMAYTLLPNTHIGDVKLTESLYEQMDNVSKGSDPNDYLSKLASLIEDDVKVVKENAEKLPSVKYSSASSSTELVCPVCGKPIRRLSWGYACTGYPNCNFTVSFNAFGAKLTDEIIIRLLKTHTTRTPISCKNKEGKKYRAILNINKEGKIEPSFVHTKFAKKH